MPRPFRLQQSSYNGFLERLPPDGVTSLQLARWQHGHYFWFARQTLFVVLLFLCINAGNCRILSSNDMRIGHIGMPFTNGWVYRSRLTKTRQSTATFDSPGPGLQVATTKIVEAAAHTPPPRYTASNKKKKKKKP